MWALLGRVSLLCIFLKPFVTPPNLCPPWRWAAGGGQRPVGGGDPIPQFLPLCHPLLARIGAELRRPDAVLAPSASTGRLHGLYQFQYNVAGSNDNPLLAGDVRGGFALHALIGGQAVLPGPGVGSDGRLSRRARAQVSIGNVHIRPYTYRMYTSIGRYGALP